MYQPINSAYQTIRGAGSAAATLAVVGTLAALVAACGGSSGPEPRKIETIVCTFDGTTPVGVLRGAQALRGFGIDAGYAARVNPDDVIGTELDVSKCTRGGKPTEEDPQKIRVIGSDQKLYGIKTMEPGRRYRFAVNRGEHEGQLDRRPEPVDESKESKR